MSSSSSKILELVITKAQNTTIEEFIKCDKEFLYLALDDPIWIKENLGEEFNKAKCEGLFELCSNIIIEKLYNGFLDQKKNKAKEIEIIEGNEQCISCGSKRIKARDMQSRSGDEGATTYYKCAKCGTKF